MRFPLSLSLVLALFSTSSFAASVFERAADFHGVLELSNDSVGFCPKTLDFKITTEHWTRKPELVAQGPNVVYPGHPTYPASLEYSVGTAEAANAEIACGPWDYMSGTAAWSQTELGANSAKYEAKLRCGGFVNQDFSTTLSFLPSGKLRVDYSGVVYADGLNAAKVAFSNCVYRAANQ